MERVSSPEQLTDYIRVTNPGAWLILAAAAVLLAGFLVWGVVGSLETKVTAAAVSAGEKVVCYVGEAEAEKIGEGDIVRIGGGEYTVAAVGVQPVAVDDSFSAYALRIGGLAEGQWVVPVTVNAVLPDGTYEAAIVTDSVSPISFLFN